MRPLELVIAGFGPFRDAQTVSFDGVSQVALVGPNGAGKSTILDSILFALYGYTRTADLDAVVNTAEGQGSVTLTFESAGRRYRVSRSRKTPSATAKTGRTTASFEELIDGQWEKLYTAIREVDEAVADVVGTDVDGLLATSFSRQEDSGRFTSLSAAERRSLLLGLFDLTRFEEIAQLVKSDLSDGRRKSDRMSGRLDEAASSEGESVSDLESKLDRLVSDFDAAIFELSSVRKLDVEPLNGLSELLVLQGETEAEISRARSKVPKGLVSDEEFNRMADHLSQARSAVEVASSEATAAIEERHRWGLILAEEKSELSSLRDKLASIGALVASANEAEALIEKSASDAAKQVELRDELAETEGAFAEAEAELKLARRRLEAARGLLVDESPVCPTCGANVDQAHIAEEVDSLEKQCAELADECAGLKSDAADIRGELSDVTEVLRRVDVAKSLVEKHDLDELVESQRDFERMLGEKEASHAARSRDYEREILGACQQTHAALKTAKQTRDSLEAEFAAAEAGRREYGRLVAKIEVAESQLAKRVAEIAAAASEAGFDGDIPSSEDVKGELSDVMELVATLEQQANRLQSEVSAVATKLQMAQEREERIRQVQGELDDVASDMEVLEILHSVFSAGGIPDIILESLVEQLSSEISSVLSDLSDGRMTAQLRTTRETKSGSSKPSVNLVVENETGVRPYESFSGGERLRVDIAVRVALASLLSSRAQAPLDFLVIDEGFGRLDQDGVEALIRCVERLETRFGLILVVTHVPGIAEAFGSRMTVAPSFTGPVVELPSV